MTAATEIDTKRIADELSSLKPDVLYPIHEIVKRGLILNGRGKPCIYTAYRYIAQKRIKVVVNAPPAREGRRTQRRYFALGSEIERFVRRAYLPRRREVRA